MTDAQIAATERYLFWLLVCLFVAQAIIPGAPGIGRFLFAVIVAVPLLVAVDAFTYCWTHRHRRKTWPR